MRISSLTAEKTPWLLRPFFWMQRRKYGQPLEAALVWARRPRLFLAIANLYGALDRRRSPISPTIRSLVTVRVSQLNHCRFCVDLNSATLAKRAGSTDKVLALETWRDSDLYTPEERAVLAYAEAMTLSDAGVTDSLADALRPFLDEDGIVELTALIAFQNLSSKFNSALDVPPQGFCSVAFSSPETEEAPQ